MESIQLSKGSQYLLKIAGPQKSVKTGGCQKGGRNALLGLAGLASGGTEVFWIPVSLKEGSGGIQFLLAEGMFVSMALVKFACYRDLIDAGLQGQSEEEVEALGHRTGKVGTVVRLGGSLLTALIVEFPLAWQVGHDTGSDWKGAIGGYGDTPVSWFSVDYSLRTALRFDGYTKPKRQLNQIRRHILEQMDETIQLVNRGEVAPDEWLQFVERLRANDKALGRLMDACCHDKAQESRWVTAGRVVMDVIGTGLTASHLWMMGGLARNGTEAFTGSETAGYVGGVISALAGFGVAVESIGTAPRNFYDAAVGYWKGERPFFPRLDRLRAQLLVLALWHSAFSIASALDGADQTTSGEEQEIQRPGTAIGLSMMSFWGWIYVINVALKEGARRADPETQTLASALDRLEGIKGAIQGMSTERFAQFLLDLPGEKLDGLLAVTGGEGLSRNGVRRLAGYPGEFREEMV